MAPRRYGNKTDVGFFFLFLYVPLRRVYRTEFYDGRARIPRIIHEQLTRETGGTFEPLQRHTNTDDPFGSLLSIRPASQHFVTQFIANDGTVISYPIAATSRIRLITFFTEIPKAHIYIYIYMI